MLVWLKIAAIYLAACALLALFIGPMIAYGNKDIRYRAFDDIPAETAQTPATAVAGQSTIKCAAASPSNHPVGIIHPPPYGAACCLL